MTAPALLAAPSEEYVSSELRQAVEVAARRPGVRTWSFQRAGRWTGLAQLEPLEWDSRMLGRPAARLNWLLAPGDYDQALQRKRKLLDWALEEAQRREIEYVVARPPSDDLPGIHALQSRGFEMLDVILTFSRSPEGAVTPASGTRLARPGDVPALRRIAESSFRYDRYHADPAIPCAVADRLHGEWIASSVGGFADAVLVAQPQGALIGFCTLKRGSPSGPLLGVSVATIVLVATAAEARGQGAGRLLTRAALAWCYEQGMDRVEVGTQMRNVPASRLYASEGFQFVHASVSMRWLGRKQ